jgi:hypothetical protein
MNLIWFDSNRLGVVEGCYVRDVTAAPDVLPASRSPSTVRGDTLIAHLDFRLRTPPHLGSTGSEHTFRDVGFRSPAGVPTKTVDVLVNCQKT